jgi:hypothetical protein
MKLFVRGMTRVGKSTTSPNKNQLAMVCNMPFWVGDDFESSCILELELLELLESELWLTPVLLFDTSRSLWARVVLDIFIPFYSFNLLMINDC